MWKSVLAVVGSIALASCAGGNQMLATSGGAQDFAAMSTVSSEYGDAEADATVSVISEGQERPFRVWMHKTKSRVMVQTGDLARVASAGFVRGLTYGLVQHDPPSEPFREAGARFLVEAKGPGCIIGPMKKLTRDAYDFEYTCIAPPTAKRPNGGARR